MKHRSTSRRTEHASRVRSPEAELSYPDVSYAVWSASAAAAITSISTLAPLGSAETWTVERAGGSFLKYEPYISYAVFCLKKKNMNGPLLVSVGVAEAVVS